MGLSTKARNARPTGKPLPCVQGILPGGVVVGMASRLRSGLACMTEAGGGRLWEASTGAVHATLDGRPFGLAGVVDMEIYDGAESGALVSAYAYGPDGLGDYASWRLIRGGVSAAFLDVPAGWDRTSVAAGFRVLADAVLSLSPE